MLLIFPDKEEAMSAESEELDDMDEELDREETNKFTSVLKKRGDKDANNIQADAVMQEALKNYTDDTNEDFHSTSDEEDSYSGDEKDEEMTESTSKMNSNGRSKTERMKTKLQKDGGNQKKNSPSKSEMLDKIKLIDKSTGNVVANNAEFIAIKCNNKIILRVKEENPDMNEESSKTLTFSESGTPSKVVTTSPGGLSKVRQTSR